MPLTTLKHYLQNLSTTNTSHSQTKFLQITTHCNHYKTDISRSRQTHNHPIERFKGQLSNAFSFTCAIPVPNKPTDFGWGIIVELVLKNTVCFKSKSYESIWHKSIETSRSKDIETYELKWRSLNCFLSLHTLLLGAKMICAITDYTNIAGTNYR